MMFTRIILATAVFAALPCTPPASAQWFKLTTPGIPRTADGKPNLSAPAPRGPDGKPSLNGIWQMNGRYLQNIAADLKPDEVPYQPWAEKIFRSRQDLSGAKDDPAVKCMPGMPKLDALPYPFKIIETPGMVMILFEGFTTFRQIFTDGRELPKDPQPAWMGYSVGKWEGDDWVVDTNGINESTWLDNAGRPHSDALHLVERFRRRDFGHMDIYLTIDDPKAYTKPWTVKEDLRLIPDTELLEYVCNENNKDYEHIVGK
jgi:hypothetical protein